jgi:glycosyltransferase involved in cell wall biosynthesis
MVSVVIPCLNEADSLGTCLEQAWIGLRQLPESGEVIVADNGSSDGSQEIAARHGATVINVSLRGYGAALMAGIAAARGRWILMADADASYDFSELPRFIAELRAGAELVMGCRLPAGGGTVKAGAMPL